MKFRISTNDRSPATVDTYLSRLAAHGVAHTVVEVNDDHTVAVIETDGQPIRGRVTVEPVE